MIDYTLPEIVSSRVILFEDIWSSTFHRSQTHELLHVLGGRFQLTYRDGRTYPGARGDTFLIPAETLHEDVFERNRELRILIVHFRWDAHEEVLGELDNGLINKVAAPVRSELRWIFEHMRGENTVDALENARLLHALLLLHRELSGEHAAPIDANGNELAASAREYLKRHYDQRLSLREVASHFKVTESHLSRVFARECGFTFSEYLTELRIDQAKKLLRDGRLLVGEVAVRTGFDNANYFAKVFRKKTGCAPGKYR